MTPIYLAMNQVFLFHIDLYYCQFRGFTRRIQVALNKIKLKFLLDFTPGIQ